MELLNNLPHGPIVYLSPIAEPQYYTKEQKGAKYQTCIVHVLAIDWLVRGKRHKDDEYGGITYRSEVDG